jgi:uncharacterized protein
VEFPEGRRQVPVLEAIQLLLDAGAVIDARDAHGDTPLSWASWYLRPRSILRLLCYGKYTVRAGTD